MPGPRSSYRCQFRPPRPGLQPPEAETPSRPSQGSSAFVSSLSSCLPAPAFRGAGGGSLDQQLRLVSGSVCRGDVKRVEATRLAVDLDCDSLVQGVAATRGEMGVARGGQL